MGTKVPVRQVLRLCDPRATLPWPCPAPSEGTLQRLLATVSEVDVPVAGDGTAEAHVGRGLYLARRGWGDPIELDVGVPCLGYAGPRWPLMDGNHRLWAAILRGDEAIEVDVAGQVDHAAKLLGVSEADILSDRVEYATGNRENDRDERQD
jgi:hypothetical protein